jgi:excisionase family DNA binding protein
MAIADLKEETYLPSDVDGAQLAKLHDFVRAHESGQRVYLQAGRNKRVEVPGEVYQILRQVVEAMGQGLAVRVVPQSHTVTTQQAADLLGVSRPTVVRLLDESRIPYERVGTHRRLPLRDVLRYREERREDQ